MTTTIALTYGVCVDGSMPDDSHEFTDPAAAVARAEEIKREHPDDLVTICLWEA